MRSSKKKVEVGGHRQKNQAFISARRVYASELASFDNLKHVSRAYEQAQQVPNQAVLETSSFWLFQS